MKSEFSARQTVTIIFGLLAFVFIVSFQNCSFLKSLVSGKTTKGSTENALTDGRGPSSFDPTKDCLSVQIPVTTLETLINFEANDYAALSLDAANPDCAPTAAPILLAKVKRVVDFSDAGGTVTDARSFDAVDPFRNWLWGTPITHLFVAALHLSRQGLLTAETEALLLKVRDKFATVNIPQDIGILDGGQRSWGCGHSGNSCMDDYALTAAGFAWIGAFEKIRGRNPVPYTDKAWISINGFFKPLSEIPNSYGSVCYYIVGSNPVSCTGNPADVSTGKVRIIGVDHGQENPAYGLGLVTGLASACAGMYLAGSTCNLSDTQKDILSALLEHAQQKALPDGSKFREKDCLSIGDPTKLVDCSDATIGDGGYFPKQFPVKRFFDKRGIAVKTAVFVNGISQPAFQFDEYAETRTSNSRSAFWGLNRVVFYKIMSFEWWPPGVLPAFGQ